MSHPTPAPRTNVYIDGFNVYYGCVQGTPYKWLDMQAMVARMFPDNAINRVRYFTAAVIPPTNDPSKRERQLTYHRALRTIPNLSIHEGRFMINRPLRELVTSAAPGGLNLVKVHDPKEKGTDVSLATYLLIDGFQGDYEVAIVVSNDTDLCLPIEMVRTVLGLTVIVAAPVSKPKRRASQRLLAVATKLLSIREQTVRASQFPPTLSDAIGTFHKPAGW